MHLLPSGIGSLGGSDTFSVVWRQRDPTSSMRKLIIDER